MRQATEEMVAAAYPPGNFEPIVSSSPFGWENGPIFEQANDDGWVRGFRVAEKHSNAAGICHGGMLMTFADILLSRAVLDVVAPPFVTVRLVSDFMGPAMMGDWVEGKANVVGVEDGMVSLTGQIYTEGTPVLSVSALFKKLGSRSKG